MLAGGGDILVELLRQGRACGGGERARVRRRVQREGGRGGQLVGAEKDTSNAWGGVDSCVLMRMFVAQDCVSKGVCYEALQQDGATPRDRTVQCTFVAPCGAAAAFDELHTRCAESFPHVPSPLRRVLIFPAT